MKHLVFGLIMVAAITGLAAAQDETTSAYPSPLSAFPPPTIGIELDAVPYFTGGWYGSLWFGYRQLRLRGVVAEVYPPDMAIDDDFRDLRIKAVAAIVDWFPFNAPGSYHGPWIGGGVEWWKNRATNDANDHAGMFNSTVFTLGGGYVWKFYQNFYLNPWLAGHLLIDGGKAPIAGTEYKQPSFLPELSLKLGWHL